MSIYADEMSMEEEGKNRAFNEVRENKKCN